MTVGADYPVPVYVNGYACNNCAQVAEAKRDIDPADPQAGPGGIDATSASNTNQSPAFTLGGVLANGAVSSTSPATQPSSGLSLAATGYGVRLDLSA